MGLLEIGRGYEHNFFNGTLSKGIATNFLDDLVNLYTKFILEEDNAFTSDDLEIFKYMVDNHTIMMKDYGRIQADGSFKKYKILYEKEKRTTDDFNWYLIRLDGLVELEDLNKDNKKKVKTEIHHADDKFKKEIRDTIIN